MMTTDAAAEQIPAEPASLVIESRLVREIRCAARASEIIRLNELRIAVDSANRLHRQDRASTLVNECTRKARVVATMRKPMSVQPTKSRRRQRLVNRCVCIRPGVALG